MAGEFQIPRIARAVGTLAAEARRYWRASSGGPSLSRMSGLSQWRQGGRTDYVSERRMKPAPPETLALRSQQRTLGRGW